MNANPIVTVCCTLQHHSQTPIRGVGKFCDFRLKSPFISQTVQYRFIVAGERYYEVIDGISIRVVSLNDLERQDAWISLIALVPFDTWGEVYF